MSDTERMLQPKGLFASPPAFGPWPGSPAAGGLYAPPLPGPGGPGPPPPLPPEGMSATLPRGMQQLPPGTPYPPGGPYPPNGGFPPGGPYPPGQGRRRLSGPMVPAIVAAVLVLVVGTVVYLASRGGGGSGSAGATAASTPAVTASATTTGHAQRAAAAQLAGLLSQSGTDRTDVINAVGSVRACDNAAALRKDATTFSVAAANRQKLLSGLASLPGRSALPAAMISDLTAGWQASAQVDTDLAKWATAAASHCRKGNQNDPSLKASYGPDGQATAGKQGFARLWNPLARKYALPTYQWEQL